MYPFFRPILFRSHPEVIHDKTISLLKWIGNSRFLFSVLGKLFRTSTDPIQLFGLTFPNRVGLAAGFDKKGEAIRGLESLGFGHIEIGTVTAQPQAGNPKPRIFRLVDDRALINSMGFPSPGAEAVVQNLRAGIPSKSVLGVNIGKNQATPLDQVEGDYIRLVEVFAGLADYIAVNISSPNTVGLRKLQSKIYLERLLKAIHTRRNELDKLSGKSTPVLVKLSPDLTDIELNEALDAILSAGMDGVIATNTTTDRTGLRSSSGTEGGGLSGAPLAELSTEMVKKITEWTGGSLPVIGVGGIMSVEDVSRKLEAGASLLQIYTGLVYKGPFFVRDLIKGIRG
jgi:dihydroorotate dehydrogenase